MNPFKAGDKVTYNNGKAVGIITGFYREFWTNQIGAYVKGELWTNAITIKDLKPA